MTSNLKTEHKPGDRFYWLLQEAPYRIIAIVSIGLASLYWLAVYLGLFFISQLMIIRFLCTHCPQYCKQSKKLKCMYLWNFRKIFRRRNNPPKKIEKNIVHAVYFIVYIFPVYWIWPNILLLIIYILTIVTFIITINRYECTRCIYFDCPNNKVSEEIKEQYKNK